MTMENHTKFKKELTSQFKTDMKNLIKKDPSTQRSQKWGTLMGCFWSKYIIFKHGKYRGVMFDGTHDCYRV